MRLIEMTHSTRRSNTFAKLSRAFTVLELLVCVSVIGVLAGLILPAVQAARESARRLECMQNLRQIGLALDIYHDAHRRLPAGWSSIPGTSTALGWAAKILPHLEQQQLRRLVDDHASILAQANAEARSTTLASYLCASDVEEHQFELFKEIGDHESSAQSSAEVLVELPAANYLGVFWSKRSRCRADKPRRRTICSGQRINTRGGCSRYLSCFVRGRTDGTQAASHMVRYRRCRRRRGRSRYWSDLVGTKSRGCRRMRVR